MALKKLLFLLSFVFALTSAELYGQVEDIAGRNSLFYYSGTIDNTDKIEFNIQVEGQIVTGSYIIENSGELFIFSGRLSADKNAFGVLVYYHGTDEYAGAIEAQISSNENNFMKSITGKWKSVDGATIKMLTLDKIAELTRNVLPPTNTLIGD